MNPCTDLRRHPRPRLCLLAVIVLLGLSACGQSESTSLARIDLERIIAAPVIMASPDVSGAKWVETGTPHVLDFVTASDVPLLSLACDPGAASIPQMRIIRHAPADAEATAMMALIGNGRISRLKTQAVMGEHWEALVPAHAPELDVFAGLGAVEATLPGTGTLIAGRSDLPRQLLAACRDRVPPA